MRRRCKRNFYFHGNIIRGKILFINSKSQPSVWIKRSHNSLPWGYNTKFIKPWNLSIERVGWGSKKYIKFTWKFLFCVPALSVWSADSYLLSASSVYSYIHFIKSTPILPLFCVQAHGLTFGLESTCAMISRHYFDNDILNCSTRGKEK